MSAGTPATLRAGPRDARDPRPVHVAGNAAIKATGVLLSLGTVVLLARVLGAEQYGIYAYGMSLASVLTIPAQFGLPDLIVRETARAEIQDNWSAMRGLWRWSLGAATLCSATVLLLAGGAGLLLAAGGRGHYLPAILCALPLVPMLVWINLLGAALIGLRRVVLGQLPELLVKPGTLLLALLGAAWLFASDALSALTALALTVLSAAASLLLAAALLRQVRPPRSRAAHPVYHQRAWLAAALPLALVAGTHLIILHTDILVLGLFTTPEEVGIYRVVTQGTLIVAFGLQVVNMVVTPHLARWYEAGERARLQKLVTDSSRLALLCAVPAAALLVLFGDVILALVFGEPYGAGHTAMAILVLGQLVNAGFGSVGVLLNMTGYERVTATTVGIAAVCNVLLNLLLVPALGAIGAALATSTAFALWNVVLWREARHRLELDTTPLDLSIRTGSP